MGTKHLSNDTINKMKHYRDIGKSVKYIMSACDVSRKSVIRYTKTKTWKIKRNFNGEIIIRDKDEKEIHREPFKCKQDRKTIQDKLTTLYHDKLTSRQWTISILLQ